LMKIFGTLLSWWYLNEVLGLASILELGMLGWDEYNLQREDINFEVTSGKVYWVE
jgi:hypothetical protein